MPPPEPRSRTVSPGCSAARAVGLPQPSDASTAPSGSPVVSPASYSCEVMGSPQQLLLFSPSSTRNAAWPYFSRTVSLTSGPLIRSSLSLAAGGPATPGVPAGLHGTRKCGDRFERVGIEGVIHPASLAPVGHQLGVLQRLQVKREPGLRRVEHGLQLAHAAFSVGEQAHDFEARLIGKRVEPAGGAVDVGKGRRGHGGNISTYLDVSTGPSNSALTVTVTVLALIASAAQAGCSRIPREGYSAPAATGMAIAL